MLNKLRQFVDASLKTLLSIKTYSISDRMKLEIHTRQLFVCDANAIEPGLLMLFKSSSSLVITSDRIHIRQILNQRWQPDRCRCLTMRNVGVRISVRAIIILGQNTVRVHPFELFFKIYFVEQVIQNHVLGRMNMTLSVRVRVRCHL